MFFFISAVILYKGGFKLDRYFVNPVEPLTSGAGADLTLFLMIWVISHNLVHIL